jgi:hypothetical protein
VVGGSAAHGWRGWTATLEELGRPVKPCDVVAMAKEEGFRKGVVYRTRNELEGMVVDTEGKVSPHNMWSLNNHG